MNLHLRIGMAALVVAASVAGCAQMGGGSSAKKDESAPAAVPSSGKVGPGMNAQGDVTDPTKVEAGHGKNIKGINDYEGEIVGNPVAGCKFTELQIGMGMKQATDLLGPPTDQGAYITGKAFIPFYFGSDRHRYELLYKGCGRLIFAGGSFGNFNGGNLVWVIHSASEQGYR
jgi:hypothetical protein